MRIMYQDPHLLAFKVQILQLQTAMHTAEREAFGQTISQPIEDDPDFLELFVSVTREILK